MSSQNPFRKGFTLSTFCRWLFPSLPLIALLLLALMLRAWGNNFGLPYEYHVDEDQYVRQAATMGSNGLKPADWYNPPLFKYLLLAEYGAFYMIGKLIGWFASTADFGTRMSLDPSWLYLLARSTSALFGTLTVLVVAWIGTKAYNRLVGFFGAALMAVAFLPVRESHFAVNDAAVAFFISLALLGAVGILKSRLWRWYILSGVALGLSFATKYNALAAIVPVLLAHFLSLGASRRKLELHKLLATLLIALACAIAASPYFILSPQDVWTDMSKLSTAGQTGYLWQIDSVDGYLFYLKTLFWGLGWPLAGLCIISTVAALFRRHSMDFVLLSLPWLMYLYLGSQEMFFGRFVLAIIPPLILVGTSLLVEFASKYFHEYRWQTVALLGAWFILGIQPLVASVRFDSLLTRLDTRTLAKQWIEQNIPEGSHIAMDWLFHCPALSTLERQRADSIRVYQTWMPNIADGTGLSDHSLDWYRQNGYEYLVACSSIYHLTLKDDTQNQERQSFYTSLDRELEVLQEFHPTSSASDAPFIFDEIYGPAISLWHRERPGPTIKVYHLPDRIQP